MPRSAFRHLATLVILLACCADSAPATPPPVAPATALAAESPSAVIGISDAARPLPSADATAVATASEFDDSALVDLLAVQPNVLLDIRYASTRNFVGKVIYPVARCLLRRPVAQALARVQEGLRAKGLQLLVWDCYRPFSVQERFWQLVPDSRYVARPVRQEGRPFKGSKHNRGAAIDLTLADTKGTPLVMPTDHDDFSERAHRGASDVPEEARRNAAVLERAMAAEGFVGIATEWWHFDHETWRQYPLAEQALGE